MTDIRTAARSAAKAPRSGFPAWLKGRRAEARCAAELEALDDSLLRDMGLTRDSISHIVRHGRLDQGLFKRRGRGPAG